MNRKFAIAITLLLMTISSAQAARRGASGSMQWIWYPDGKSGRNAPAGKRYFRGVVNIPAGAKIKSAQFSLTVDDRGLAYLNGKKIGSSGGGWQKVNVINLGKRLKPGRNVIAVECENAKAGAAGFIGRVEINLAKGKPITVVTGAKWKSSKTAPKGWTNAKFDDSAWAPARELGPLNSGPWGGKVSFGSDGSSLDVPRKLEPVSAEEARKMIEADWIYQVGGSPTPARSLKEIEWTRKLAKRITAADKKLTFQAELAELSKLETRLNADSVADEEQLYIEVRRIKRKIMLANPLMNFDKILLLDTPAYHGKHESAHRNGYGYGQMNGSRLTVLDGIGPDAKERVLNDPNAGYIMRMDLSFDAKKIVYGMKPTLERSFHLYEVDIDPSTGLRASGKNRKQLTNSSYDDMDPIYLTDGKIMFSTSRGNSYVRCLPPSASTVLARCDADGKNIRIISRNNEPDYTPALLPDGRVLYTRWEYTERPLWRLQKLWTINPDGTGLSVYWGNSSAHPDVMWEARAIPGSSKVIFVGVGHHNVMTGCIGIIDVTRGLEYPNGITKVTADLKWPESGDSRGPNPVTSPDYHAAGKFWSYRCPYPLGAEDFLVSAARRNNGRFDLYLMDIHGNRELLYVGQGNSWYARPLRPRAKPLARPDRVIWPKAGEKPADGVLFSSNVYQGVEGLPKGAAKYLRVFQMDAKTYSSGFKSWRHSGPAISIIQEDGVKRILGDVPIEADGSVAFKVPSGQALHFQLLDKDRRCIQIMRSFTGVMPGEVRGCLGCHGMNHASPQALVNRKPVRRAAADLTPPPWGADVSIGYERFCQPVLDKYCGKCHQGEGKGRKAFDMTLRGGVPERGITDPKMLPFKEPYLTLVGKAWGGPKPAGKGAALGFAGCINVEGNRKYGPLKPMTMLSSTSPLIKRAMSGKHHKVKIEGDDLLRLIAWVDANCVYRGDEEVRHIPDSGENVTKRFAVAPKTKTAPIIERLHPINDPKPTVSKTPK
ncbi:MAG: hypothetical protein HN350_04875 [Phycisphaerales bacterium]|jgi:hypothetical protein|nr:hypothetical protein [Phycisphaerales bacterium]